MLFSVSIFLRLKWIKSNETEFFISVICLCRTFFFIQKGKKNSNLGKHEALLKATNIFLYHIFFKYWYSWYFLVVKVSKGLRTSMGSFLNDGDTECKQRKSVNRERRYVWAESESSRNVIVLCHIPALSKPVCLLLQTHTVTHFTVKHLFHCATF